MHCLPVGGNPSYIHTIIKKYNIEQIKQNTTMNKPLLCETLSVIA